MFTSTPRLQFVDLIPGHRAVVIDDALSEPRRWVTLAAEHREAFEESPHNAYPGPELRLPEPIADRLEQFFATHVRRHLGARRTLRHYARLSMATRAPAALDPRQWIPHRDRLDTDPERCVIASVLYLFDQPALGGTAFFRPRRSERDTALLIHESGSLDAEGFERKYGITPGYPRDSAWFEGCTRIAPRFNRLIFYSGGEVFHASDIPDPARLVDDPQRGRLTLNGFFVCRRALD